LDGEEKVEDLNKKIGSAEPEFLTANLRLFYANPEKLNNRQNERLTRLGLIGADNFRLRRSRREEGEKLGIGGWISSYSTLMPETYLNGEGSEHGKDRATRWAEFFSILR
jgi:hypothetical protein